MIRRFRGIAVTTIAVGFVAALARRLRGHVEGRQAEGGILVGDPRGYDTQSRRLFGSLFDGIAADVAMAAPSGGKVLDVGSGPGHLSIRLAERYGFAVTGLDLDPEMVARAHANSEHIPSEHRPRFVVGDVAAMPFEDESFDLVVSTFSLHHWSDPTHGLNEIARVLNPGGRALVWDLNAGLRLFHIHAPDPVESVRGSDLDLVDTRPWRWPWRFTLAQRLDLARR